MSYESYPPPLPQRYPPQRNLNVPLIAVVALIGVGVIVAMVLLLRHKRPAPFVETAEQKYHDASSAFSSTVADSPAEKAALQITFNKLAAAISAHNTSRIATCFDGERMLDEAESTGLLPKIADRAGVARGMLTGFSGSLARNPMVTFVKIEVRKVRPLDDHSEAVVYTRGHNGNGTVLKFRWWAKKDSSGWRFYDMEDLDGGLRVSKAMGVAASAMGGNSPPPWAGQFSQFQSIMQNLAQQNFVAADKTLTALEAYTFPPEFAALLDMLRGIVSTSKGQFDQALTFYDKAEALHPDMPAVHYLRAVAYNNTAHPEKALAAAQKYIDLLGDDAKAYLEIGQADEALKKPAEALSAYRKGLADEPANVELRAAVRRLETTAAATTRRAATQPVKPQ